MGDESTKHGEKERQGRLHYICCKNVSCNRCSVLFLVFLFRHVWQQGSLRCFHSHLVFVLFTGYRKFLTPSNKLLTFNHHSNYSHWPRTQEWCVVLSNFTSCSLTLQTFLSSIPYRHQKITYLYSIIPRATIIVYYHNCTLLLS